MLKVALDARYGLHANRRGIGVYVYHLLQEWKSHPPDGISWVAFGDRRADLQVIDEVSGPNIAVKILADEPFARWEQWAFPRAAVRAGCTLIHATANVAPLVCPLPLVLTLHDVIEWHRGKDFPSTLSIRHRLSRLYRMNAIRRNVKQARVILTVSNHAARDITHVLGVPESKIIVTPLGYAHRQMEPDVSVLARENLVPKGYAMAFGALDPRKNVEMLVRIWQTSTMPLDLVLVGFEPYALQAVKARWASIPRIHLLGFEPDAAIRALLDNAAVFLFPSFYEGFGLPVLEAMASGIPTIVAKGTVADEIAGEAAITAEPSQPEIWQRTLIDIMKDPDLSGRLVECGSEVLRNHPWSRTALLTTLAYARACNKASLRDAPRTE